MPSRKPVKPRPMPTRQAEARHTAVLLEEIRSQVTVIAENQGALSNEFQTFKVALMEVGEDVRLLKSVVQKNTVDIQKNTEDIKTIKTDIEMMKTTLGTLEPLVEKNTTDIEAIKRDVGEMKNDLKNDLREVKERLSVVETKP